MHIIDVSINDSGNYTKCSFLRRRIARNDTYVIYDVRVIGCLCLEPSIRNGTQHISCDLSGHLPTGVNNTKVEVNGRIHVNGQITDDKLELIIEREITARSIRFSFYQDADSNISCSLELDKTLMTASLSNHDIATVVIILFFIIIAIVVFVILYKRNKDKQ